MAKKSFSVALARKQQSVLAENCFRIGRFGEPTKGIVLSLNRGPDELRPWEPHVSVGAYRLSLSRDSYKGAFYERAADGKTAIMHRALAHKIVREGKASFYTLQNPGDEKLDFSLVRISLTLPYAARVAVNSREVRVFTGVVGGTVVAHDGDEYVVVLNKEHEMELHFPDGMTRLFRQMGGGLCEEHLSHEGILDLRIEDAKRRLAGVSAFTDGERREKAVYAVLSGMADILHLTTLNRSFGQVLRMTLLREFFLSIEPMHFSLVRRKVEAILHQVDPPLVEMLYVGHSVSTTNVAKPVVVRNKNEGLTPEEIAARKEANRRKDEEDRAAKAAKQAIYKAKRKPTTPAPKQKEDKKNKNKNKKEAKYAKAA